MNGSILECGLAPVINSYCRTWMQMFLCIDVYGTLQVCFFVYLYDSMCGTNCSLRPFTCTTSHTTCTAKINHTSVRIVFCITITAHGHGQDVLSEPRCQPGRDEGETVVPLPLLSLLFLFFIFLTLVSLSFSVMLPPAILNSVKPVRGRPQCLNVTWSRILSVFPVSDPEIKRGILNSQIEFTSQGQVSHS